jgi:hypothetical protein
MSVTILEALQNAQINLQGPLPFQRAMGMEQLNNAVGLLERGYSPEDEVEPLIDKYGGVDSVPAKDA